MGKQQKNVKDNGYISDVVSLGEIDVTPGFEIKNENQINDFKDTKRLSDKMLTDL